MSSLTLKIKFSFSTERLCSSNCSLSVHDDTHKVILLSVSSKEDLLAVAGVSCKHPCLVNALSLTG